MRGTWSICLFITVAGQLGRAQAPLTQAPPTDTANLANQLLTSPLEPYLSGGGRNALLILSGRTSATMGSQPSFRTPSPGLAILEPPPPALTAVTGDVQVNNPDQDLRSNQDLSTQSEPAVAGFERIVVVAFNDSGQISLPPIPPFSFTGYSRSVDGGSTFMDIGALPPPPGGLVLGDPGLVAD